MDLNLVRTLFPTTFEVYYIALWLSYLVHSALLLVHRLGGIVNGAAGTMFPWLGAAIIGIDIRGDLVKAN